MRVGSPPTRGTRVDGSTFGAMGVTKPYEFIGSGAMEVTKPYEFIGFGAMEVTKPYEFIGSGAMDVTKHCEFIGSDPEVLPDILRHPPMLVRRFDRPSARLAV